LTLPFTDEKFKITETLIPASGENASGLRLLYNNTETSLGPASGNDYFNLQIDLFCNEAVNSTQTEFKLENVVKGEPDDNGITLTTITVSSETKYGCALYKTHYILELLSGFKYLYVVIAFVLGLVECFYGNKIFKPTLFLVRFSQYFCRKLTFLDGLRCRIFRNMLLHIQYLDWN
jgi:hypothetical protein